MNAVQPVMTWWRRWWSNEDQKSKRRPRIVLAIVVALCVTVTGIAVTGAGNAPPGLKFTQAGHWVYNSVLGTAFHVDGGSKAIDAEVSIPGLGPGSTIVQTDGEGYVLSQEQTVEFGKSDLAVTDRVEPKASEAAVGLEAAGAAYAIYPKSGNIVRFGDQPATLEVNQPLGSSVVTRTGTLWVHQLGGGQLCQLPLKATRLTCTASTRTGHKGGLAMVGDRPVFVDTTANTMTPVSGDGLGRTTRLDIDLPDTAVIAANDLGGRIAVLNPDTPTVHLVDAAAALDGEVVEPTTSTPLEPGRYERVAAAGKALVLIEENTGTVVTVDERGEVHESEKLPEPSKAAKSGKNKQAKAGMFRGDDGRVYVDSAAGEHVMVVEDDGEITPVEVTGDGEEKRPTPTTTPTTTPTSTPTPTWTPVPPKRETPKPKPRDPEPEPTREPDPEPQPEPEPKKTPDPVPASRPGAPSNVKGTAGDARITVTWGAARNNGSPITAYELSWSGGSKTVAPGARKTTITGLRNGTSYTVTVRAVNKIGDGPGVRTNAVTPAASPKIKVSRGSDTDQYCDPPDCAWMHVVMTGFAPNTQYHLQPHSSNAGYSNGGADLTTDANGRIDTERFAYESVGSTVWVTVATPNGTVTSNRLKWPGWSGDPQLVVSRGEDSSSDSCEEPDCAWLHVVMNGFEPNTEYTVTGWASEWEDFSEPSVVTTDDEGHLVFEDIRFDGGGQDVWVFTDTPAGRIESNHYYWEPQ